MKEALSAKICKKLSSISNMLNLALRSSTVKILNLHALVKTLFIPSFTFSLLTLYLMYPESFERVWKGRAYYIFFLWLFSLKLALNWREINVQNCKFWSKRLIALIIVSVSPTVYVLAENFSGLNTVIMDLSPKHYGLDWWSKYMPLTVEHLVFMVFSTVMVVLTYGINGLKIFILPISLIGVIGSIYLIDNLYPFGEFTPFQILVPTTANLAAAVLKSMGYQAELYGQIHKTPVLRVRGESGEAAFGIAWPCSGVDSLILYSVITILFLNESKFSSKGKFILFILGAAVTYFINILRITEIFIVAIKYGVTSPEVQRFHDYYGPLYSITWIIAYQLIMIGAEKLFGRVSLKRASEDL